MSNRLIFIEKNNPIKITDTKSGLVRRLIDVAPGGCLKGEKMKLKRVTFYFIDKDNVNNEEIPSLLQDYHFPNRCISPEQITIEETDIGEWSDEHRCNCPGYDLSREFTEGAKK